MRTSVLNVLLAMSGFGILIFTVPSLRYQEQAREQDSRVQRGELLFFTADW